MSELKEFKTVVRSRGDEIQDFRGEGVLMKTRSRVQQWE